MRKPSKIKKLGVKKPNWDYIPHFLPNEFTYPVAWQKEQEEKAIRDIQIEKKSGGPQHYKLEWYIAFENTRLEELKHRKVPLFLDKTKKKEEEPSFLDLKPIFIQVACRSKYIRRSFSIEEITRQILLLDQNTELYKSLQKAYYHHSNDDRLLFELECFFLDGPKYE